jgi:hypothetical protein
MMDTLTKWLNESRNAMVNMERELKQHHAAVEAAMATIRNHGDAIERLERSLEVVGRAIAETEAGLARDRKDEAPGRPETLARSAVPAPGVGARPEAPQLRAVSHS